MKFVTVLSFLLDSWHYVLIIGVAVGVLAAVISFGNYFYKRNEKHKIARVIGAVVCILSCIFVCLAAFASMFLTKVPRVEGMNLSDADEKLKEAGLQTSLEPGVILNDNWQTIVRRQLEDEGTIVLRDSFVTLFLQKNEETPVIPVVPDPSGFSTVPDVTGMEQNEAIAVLTESGLDFQVWWTEENNRDSDYYYVAGQSIPASSRVPSGSLVRLELTIRKP